MLTHSGCRMATYPVRELLVVAPTSEARRAVIPAGMTLAQFDTIPDGISCDLSSGCEPMLLAHDRDRPAMASGMTDAQLARVVPAEFERYLVPLAQFQCWFDRAMRNEPRMGPACAARR